MSKSSHQRLIDRGRKAGVNAEELYRALSSLRPTGAEPVGRPDSNGFVAHVNADGRRSYEATPEK